MDKRTRERLARAGWRAGDAQEFLQLSDEELAFIELRLALASKLKEVRTQRRVTQAQLAELIQSSQSRVAKMEAGDPSVSADLLLRSLIALGVSFTEIGGVVAELSEPVGGKRKRSPRTTRSPALRK